MPERRSGMHRKTGRGFRWLALAVSAVAALLVVAPARAQTTTSNIRGTVTNQSTSKPVEDASVIAQDKTTGFHYQSVTGADGKFLLSGLRPGSYTLNVQAPSFKPVSKDIVISLGQSIDLDLAVSPDSLFVENVTAVGDRIVETRTSVVGTSVSPEQIESLPQNDRNFLNFAQLAPGVRLSSDPNNKQVRSLGQAASSGNVFIDGVSYKNDVLEGGVVGQDSSRGNPFPQNAVQEFQVLTQNYKAEYEKASTSIISAVTKSGGNIWTGGVFLEYQNKAFVDKDVFDQKAGTPKPDYKRFQGGFDVGGPFIKDKLTWFLSYENNTQDRANRVALGTPFDPMFDTTQFKKFEGNFTSPFRSNLLFTKLSWQPALDQTVEFSFYRRDESDERSFGGQTSFQTAEKVNITIDSFAAKHKLIRPNYLNEASVEWQGFEWNPTSVSTAPQLNYFGIIQLGSRNGNQDFKQDRVAIRDDFTYFLNNAAGRHAIKAGVIANLVRYDVMKTFGGDGTFNFTYDPTNGHTYDNPFEAFIATGDPQYATHNTEFGIYLQDDWNVTPKLTLNLGVRWDYETNMYNTDFVTPASFVDAVTNSTVDGVWNRLSASDKADYISSGHNRSQFKGAIQPRLGFAYDFRGDGKSVLFGGVGRYYDRDIYNVFFDEKFRLQWRTYRICFYSNPTEQAGCGMSGVAWDPSFQNKQSLLNFVTGNQALGKPEIFLLPNDLKVPYNDQASVGYRHTFGRIVGEVAATYIHGSNGFSYIFGNRDITTGNVQDVSPEFSNLLLGTDDKEYWYRGVYIKVQRPFTADAKWGFTFTYTLSKAEQRGNDAFSLDYLTVKDYPKAPSPDDSRHHIVATGLVRVPWDVIISGALQLDTGTPTYVFDASGGFGFYEAKARPEVVRPPKGAFIYGDWWGYRQLDLRADKTFHFGKRQLVGVSLQAFNVLGSRNYGCLDGFIPPGGNPNLGNAGCSVGPTREYQVGLKYGF
jgi:Carboxypeptidase regulatory-like domain